MSDNIVKDSKAIISDTSSSSSSSSGSSMSAVSLYNIPKLDQGNWSSWFMRISAVFMDRDLDGVVDGTEILADNNSLSWKKKNKQAMAQILLTLNDDQLVHVKGIDTAKGIMDKLKQVHQSKGLASRLYLRRRLLNMKLNDSNSMSEYLVSMKKVKHQLEEVGSSVDDEDFALMILSSLPESYTPLIFRDSGINRVN